MPNPKLIHGSCAEQTVDAVVNAANSGLWEGGLHSISFPLISSGIFAGNLPNPVEESTKQCNRAYKKFIQDYPDYDIDVLLCAFTSTEYNAAKTIFEK